MSPQKAGPGHHVFTVVSGFGLRVIPRAPFRLLHGPSARELDIYHEAVGGPRFARLIADGAGGYQSKLHQHTPSLSDVVDVKHGPVPGDWQLDVGPFRASFPAGFELHSVPGDSWSLFDLIGPGQSLIYVQRPAKVPPLTALCGPGQTVSQRGDHWIELTYEHDQSPWWQRHQIADRLDLVFTAQAPAPLKDAARAALITILDSLVVV